MTFQTKTVNYGVAKRNFVRLSLLCTKPENWSRVGKETKCMLDDIWIHPADNYMHMLEMWQKAKTDNEKASDGTPMFCNRSVLFGMSLGMGLLLSSDNKRLTKIFDRVNEREILNSDLLSDELKEEYRKWSS